jgi:hypothetical protein
MALSRRALAPVGRINKNGVVSSVNCHDDYDDDDVGDVPPLRNKNNNQPSTTTTTMTKEISLSTIILLFRHEQNRQIWDFDTTIIFILFNN